MADARMLPFSTARHKRRKDQLTSVRVTRNILDAAPTRKARPHPVINIRAPATASLEEHADGEVQPDTGFEDNGWPEAGDSLFNLDINAGGLPEQLLQEESSSAFDSIRAQMHAEYLECLSANLLMFQGRKEATEVSLQAAAAAHGSHCTECGSKDLCTQGPAVSVL